MVSGGLMVGREYARRMGAGFHFICIAVTLVQWHHRGTRFRSDARINALSSSFGNFDRVVGLGWLLGDVLDLPHLDRVSELEVDNDQLRSANRLLQEEVATLRGQLSQAREDLGRLTS